MHSNASFDYAVIRVVPRVEREEFLNAGVILYAQERRYLGCHVEMDETRVMTMWPGLDFEAVANHLRAFHTIAVGGADGGPIAVLSQRERFHWLTAPRSTILQTSAVRTGVCSRTGIGCEDLNVRLREIAATMLEPERPDRPSIVLDGCSLR